ncbi:MAG: isoprenylcysteine carboxylmethyltransferase family protein [Chloroflexi bacterium]|nr:isoprenylcysteine carboxylmethyltransferase family protein [Chloroflexota bacterium]
MTPDLVFRVVFAAGTLLGLSLRMYFAWKVRRVGGKFAIKERGNVSLVLLWVLYLPTLAASLLYVLAPDLLGYSALPLPLWLRSIGAIPGTASLVLFAWSHHALGANWSESVGIKEAHSLVTDGPHRWMRHPMYTAVLLIAPAAFLISANWTIGAFWLAMGTVVYTRVGLEERFLIEKFGDQYLQYMSRTGRFLPRVKL